MTGLSLLVSVLVPTLAVAAEGFARKSVLLLYAESRIVPAILRVDEGIRSRFTTAGVEAEFLPEYLDLSWAAEPGHTTDLLAFLRSKHRHRRFDIVMAAGSAALQFALANRAELFPGVPIVFCAATQAGTDGLRLGPDVTGVWMVAEAAATVAAAVRLQPMARQLVIVGGASSLDQVFLDDVKRDLAGRTGDLEVSYLVGLPLDRVRETLAALPRAAIVLLVSMLRDGAGRSFSTPEALTRLAGTSAAPIYGLSDTLVGYGVVGGRMIVFEAQAALAADLAMRVLAGEPAGSIAPLTTSANRDLYDWRELKRWGLRERDLPPGAVMLNRVPPLWEIYRWHITATVGLIAGQAGLIGALLLHRRRRRRAEVALQERLDFETFVLDLSAGFVDQHGPGVDTAIERGCQRVTKYFGLDGAMVMELIAGEDAMRVTHAWTASSRKPAEAAEVGRFPWLVARLPLGTVHFAGLDELAPEAALDRDSFARLGVSSAIVVPLMDGVRLLGALTFSLQRRAAGQPADLLERLGFVGGIFSTLLLRRRSEVELQKLRRDLTHVGRVSTMGELAMSLAHELNQPLTAILSNAQAAERLLAKGQTKPTELREILADIVADDKRAGDVIRRLRGFLRKDPPQRGSLDLNAVIQDVVLLVHNDTIMRNVAVVLDLAPRLPAVHADRVQLQQVVLNLIMNGLDAMRGVVGHPLGIATVLNQDGNLQVAVSDRGVGLPEGDEQRVFDAFYTTKAHGLGMGLSIVRSLIHAHDGQVWARNNEDGGATFTFTLPAEPAMRAASLT